MWRKDTERRKNKGENRCGEERTTVETGRTGTRGKDRHVETSARRGDECAETRETEKKNVCKERELAGTERETRWEAGGSWGNCIEDEAPRSSPGPWL